MIEIKNLSKNFNGRSVLKDISIRFERGKVYGIAGENGAGKTTLFRCIAGLESFTGEVLSNLNPLKNHLGLLLTEPYFFDKIKGGEYIRLLCDARGAEVVGVDDQNIFDLPLEQYASTYSTGMKKKLALCAILFQKNDYFILDEPFNGVDIQSNIMIAEIIRKLRGLGKVVILSSHIFATLTDVCDEILLLRDGAFVHRATPENFPALEATMKTTLGKEIDRIILQ